MKIPIKIENLKVSKVIKYFLITDMLFLGGWGLIGPVFGVFVLDYVPRSTLFTIGAVSALYWIVKSIVQIPVSIYLDTHTGEKDDFYALVFSLALAGFAAMAFLLVKDVAGLFAVQILHAIAMGFYTPSWSAIYARHLDKDHYSFDWSLDSTLLGLSYAATALIGGGISAAFGFQAVFILVSVFSFGSAFVLFSVPHLIFPKTTSDEKAFFRDHTPHTIGQ